MYRIWMAPSLSCSTSRQNYTLPQDDASTPARISNAGCTRIAHRRSSHACHQVHSGCKTDFPGPSVRRDNTDVQVPAKRTVVFKWVYFQLASGVTPAAEMQMVAGTRPTHHRPARPRRLQSLMAPKILRYRWRKGHKMERGARSPARAFLGGSGARVHADSGGYGADQGSVAARGRHGGASMGADGELVHG